MMRWLHAAVASAALAFQPGCGVIVLLSIADADDPRITDFEVIEPSLEAYEGPIPFLAEGEAVRATTGPVHVKVDGETVAEGEPGEPFTWEPEGERRRFILEITWGISDPGAGHTYQATDMREIEWRPSFGIDIEVCPDDAPCELLEDGAALTVHHMADVRAVAREPEDEVASASFTLGGTAVPPDGADAAELDFVALPDGPYSLVATARLTDGAEATATVELTHAACGLPEFDMPATDAGGVVGLAFDATGAAYIAGVRDGSPVIDRVSGPPMDTHEPGWISASEGRFGPIEAGGGILHYLYTPPSGDVQLWRASTGVDPSPELVRSHPTAFDIITLPDGTAVYATIHPDTPSAAQLWHLRGDDSVFEVTSPRRPPRLPLYFLSADVDEVIYIEKDWFRSVDLTGEPTEKTYGDSLDQLAGMASYGAGWFVATEAGTLKVVEDERFFYRQYWSMDWLDDDQTGGGRAELARSTRAPDCALAYAATRDGLIELVPRP